MATIQIKRSTVAGRTPTTLLPGELAINETDGVLYWLDNNNVIQSTPLFSAPLEGMASNNLIINGGMEVSQQFGSSNVALSSNNSPYVVDQWIVGFNKTGATFSSQQTSTNNAPHFNTNLVLKVTNSSFTSPLTGTDYAIFAQYIEGVTWSRLSYGTTSAMPVTVGFWCFPTVSGIGTFSIRQGAQGAAPARSYVQDFAVVGGQWNWVSFTIPGEQTSTSWFGWTAAAAAVISFCFGTGSTYQGPNKQWSNANYLGTPNTTNFFSTINNSVTITGVVLVPGALSIPSSHAPYMINTYPDEIIRCLRYYEQGQEFLSYRNNPLTGITTAYDSYQFRVQKRVNPSMTYDSYMYYQSGNPVAFTPTTNVVDINHFELLAQSVTNWTGWYNTGHWQANARM